MKKFLFAMLLSLAAGGARAAACNASATGLVFGSYTPNQPHALDSAGTITVACSKGAMDALPLTVNYAVEIAAGLGGRFQPRAMKSGTNALQYNLYRDSPRITVWGDGTGGSSTVMGSQVLQAPTGSSSQALTVYGRLFAGQNAVPGAYNDTIVVTISY